MSTNASTKLPIVLQNSVNVTQANSFAIGDAIYFNGSTWAKAQANASATLGLAIVSACTGTNFTAQFSGPIAGLGSLGLIAGQYYFVSDSSAGALTATAPTSNTSYANPILFTTSTTEGVVLPFRPSANGPAIVWPGTASQLTAGDGSAVTVGSGLSLTGATLKTTAAKVRLRFTTNKSVNSSTDTPLIWTVEDFDTDNMHDDTNPTRITFRTAGTYLVGGMFRWVEANGTGDRAGSIRLNGNTFIMVNAETPSSSTGATPSNVPNTLYQFSVNDYIELVAYQTSGSTLNAEGTASFQSNVFWAIQMP